MAPPTMALATLAARQVVNDSSTEEKGQGLDKAIIVTVILVVAGVALGLGAYFTYACVQKCREKKAKSENTEKINDVSPA